MRYGAVLIGGLAFALVLAKGVLASGLPEGPGLSAKYLGDTGLQSDPAVIIVENFEAGSLEALARAGIIEPGVRDDMMAAYVFLREVEHRLVVEEEVHLTYLNKCLGEAIEILLHKEVPEEEEI